MPPSRSSSPVPAAASPPLAATLNWPVGWICTAIFFATFFAYLPALKAGFIWDDAGHVTRADLRSLSGLFRIWFELGATQQYYPLLHSAFWLEHHLWGDATVGYHLINILLHATSACLLGVVLRRLSVPGAWWAALLFALHPVGVESVAWVSEQKNTLSTVFYLLAALTYLRFDTERRPERYALATLLFAMALMSKSVTATLPAALLVIFWWLRGRLSLRRDWLPLAPWFALSAIAALVTSSFEHNEIGAQGSDFALSFMQRGLIAGRAICFYLGKLIWPSELVFIYPRWTVDASKAWQYLFPLAALLMLGAAGWLYWRRRQRGPLAAFLLFAGTLFPALGFINVYPFIFSFVADHFQYLACMAVFALAAVGFTKASAALPQGVGATGIVALLLVLASLTWAQAKIYRDVFSLYRDTIARNPDCWMAHNNLAMALAESGQYAEAVPHLETALKLRPDFPQAESNFGDTLTHLGRAAAAIPHLERALQLQPKYPEALNNLGAALMNVGRTEEGLAKFREAIRQDPNYAMAHHNFGLALGTTSSWPEAIAQLQEAARLNPAYADTHYLLGVFLSTNGRFAEGEPHFLEAIRLSPHDPQTHAAYASFLAKAGRMNDAYREQSRARELGASPPTDAR